MGKRNNKRRPQVNRKSTKKIRLGDGTPLKPTIPSHAVTIKKESLVVCTPSSEEDEVEAPRSYDLLMSSLNYEEKKILKKRPKIDGQFNQDSKRAKREEKKIDFEISPTSSDNGCGGSDGDEDLSDRDGDEMISDGDSDEDISDGDDDISDGGDKNISDGDKEISDGDSAGGNIDDDDGSIEFAMVLTDSESEGEELLPDPFSVHFEQDLQDEEAEELSKILPLSLKYQHSLDAVLGGVSEAKSLSTRTPPTIKTKGKSLHELHVKDKLSSRWLATHSESSNDDDCSLTKFSQLQERLFSIMASYRDLLYARRSFDNGEEIRRIYLLHALNHITKTRSKVLKNNAKLAQAAKNGTNIEEVRDQGLTRPKILILLPFREAALRTVNMLISLIVPKGQGQVSNRKRFMEEFSEEDYAKPEVEKPASYESTFAGNIDDCFRLGITIKRNAVNLYAEFYSSDIIIASPLGLRTIIGAEGDRSRDFDFLSSLEVIILDQADVYLMQNWDHMLHLFDHTHLQPSDSHGVDFSRVRMWSINGWSKFYRQTLIFSDFVSPEINSLFSKECKNYAGKVKVCETSHTGSISQVKVPVSHVFHRFTSSSHADLPKARFQYFIDRILPDFTGELMKQTCILVPSYFDFIRLRNHMTKEEMNFVQLCEYTKTSNISRGRTNFFHGKAQFLLYTERMHFFRRFKIRGIRHIIFYSPPYYAEFYPELINLLEEMLRVQEVTCTVIYSRYDVLALCRIVGSHQAKTMINAMDNMCSLVTGQRRS